MDPDHPIIDRPFEYGIESVHIEAMPQSGGEPYLDLILRRGDVRRHLRFHSPQDIEIEGSGCFPQATRGMQILDVSGRQLDGLAIQVSDFEATLGAIKFSARDVVDVDDVNSR